MSDEPRMMVAFFPYGGMEPAPTPHVELCAACWHTFCRLLREMSYEVPRQHLPLKDWIP